MNFTEDGGVRRINEKKLITLVKKNNDKKAAGEIVKLDRKSTRLNSSHSGESRMPSSA